MNLINFYWFRRDLRLFDNAALHFSLKSDGPVLCLFIFDLDILDQLDDRSDARVTFIHQRLQELDRELKNYGSSLLVKIGRPVDVWKELLTEYNINGVFVNTDYEPYAGRRDKEIRALLTDNSVSFSEFKDQVIFEKNEVTKDDGLPYTVFTPYMKKWKGILTSDMLRPYNNADLGKNLLKNKDLRIPTLSELNFIQSSIAFPQVRYSEKIWSEYAEKRNIPHFDSTTKLSLYLRFGLVSIRELVKKAMLENETLLNEFIWREFFMQILWNFPHVADRSF